MTTEPHPLLSKWRLSVWCLVLAVPCCGATSSGMLVAQDTSSGDWPEFRGPSGQGWVSDQKLPTLWSERKNVRWKTPIAGQGWSSPVIQGNQIWLTSALDSGRSLRAICLDSETGEIRFDVEVFSVPEPGELHPKNSHASPTPVIDGDRIFVHFGAHGTACLSNQGEILWKTQLPYYHHHGPAASPVLADGVLIVTCDGFTQPFWDRVQRPGVTANQFIAGIDSETGEILWKTPRQGRHSYCTPLVIEWNGARQVISPGGDGVVAYEPATGRQQWWCRYQGYSVTPRPVFGNGLIYVCTGYDHPSLLAIRPDGEGDVTETHIQWKSDRSIPLTPSPLLVDQQWLYLISDAGILSCLEATTGNQLWKRRLSGKFSASPIVSDSRIYLLNENGQMEVIQAGDRYKKLSSSTLPGRTFASPAAAGNRLYLRTEEFLYCIQDQNTP
jgi:outer membrane protein assembly factor BamB